MKKNGTIFDIKYYNTEDKSHKIFLTNLPKKRQYAQIATLKKTDDTSLEKNSPRSNQIVAGTQIIGDDIPPFPEITLIRPKIGETISTGKIHQGYVSTYYTFDATRTDNVAVAQVWIEADNQIIKQQRGNRIQLENLYFTENTTAEYTFGAADFEGNITREKVTLNIDIPNISIARIDRINDGLGTITARLSHDVDEGFVSFQKYTNQRESLIGNQDGNQAEFFPTMPKQVLITGGIFDIGNTVALYAPNGNKMGEMQPTNGKVTIQPEYRATTRMFIDFSSRIPILKIVDTSTQKTLFWIYLPGEELTADSLQVTQGTYKIVQLEGTTLDTFNNGWCLQKDNACTIYVSKQGNIYVPPPYNSQFTADYRFIPETETIEYIIRDQSQTVIARMQFKMKSFFK